MMRLVGSIAWFVLAPLVLAGCGGAMSAADANQDAAGSNAHIGRYTMVVTIEGQSAGVFEGVEGLTIDVDIPDRRPAVDVRVVNTPLPVYDVNDEPAPEEIDTGGIDTGELEDLGGGSLQSQLPISDYNRVVPGPVRYHNIVLKKGALWSANTQPSEDELWRDWFGSIVALANPPQPDPDDPFAGLRPPVSPEQIAAQLLELTRSGSIEVRDAQGNRVASYGFSGAWPCRVSGFRIDANGQAVHAGEIELVVTTLTIRDDLQQTSPPPFVPGPGGGEDVGGESSPFPFFKPKR